MKWVVALWLSPSALVVAWFLAWTWWQLRPRVYPKSGHRAPW